MSDYVPWMQTVSGRKIEYESGINIDDEIVRDLCHAVGNICRFTGHSRAFFSVAQHSVFVASLLPEEYQLWGLVHDLHEGIIGDVAAPLKILLPEYNRIERKIQRQVYDYFELYDDNPPSWLEWADKAALVTEAALFVGDTSKWQVQEKPMDVIMSAWEPHIASNVLYAYINIVRSDEGFVPPIETVQDRLVDVKMEIATA